jgi:hypothetical protein
MHSSRWHDAALHQREGLQPGACIDGPAVIAERNGRLAMEAVSELGPEAGAALLATRSAEEIARLAQEIPSDDAAALIDDDDAVDDGLDHGPVQRLHLGPKHGTIVMADPRLRCCIVDHCVGHGHSLTYKKTIGQDTRFSRTFHAGGECSNRSGKMRCRVVKTIMVQDGQFRHNAPEKKKPPPFPAGAIM